MLLLTIFYSLTILVITGFILSMIFRSVKALEKIADAYTKKNGSV